MKKHFITTCILLVSIVLSSCELLEDLFPKPPVTKDKTYTAFLSGSQEVPAVPATGAGQGMFTLNGAGTEISYKLIVANTEKILAAHIHLAPMGVNGPVVAFLLQPQSPPTGLVNGVLAEGKIMQANLIGPLAGKPLSDLINALESGNAYVNVHTEKYPAGELRGQIRKPAAKPVIDFSAILSGDQEVPPVTTDAGGLALLGFNQEGTELKFRVEVSKLNDPLFSHIHLAPVGVNGGVVVTLRPDKVEGQVNGKYAEGTIRASDLSGNLKGGPLSILKEAMESGFTYVNIHTEKYKAGELRGQIMPSPIQ